MIDTMSLQEMESYLGRQEVPTDFDQFWQGHLASLPDLPDFELVEKEVGLEGVACFELTFIGQGGSKIFSKVIFPKKEEKIPVLFYFHGYQGQGPDWSELLKYTAVGIGVVAMDVRGQAGRSQDLGCFEGITVKGQVIRGMVQGPNHLFYKDVYLDVYQLIRLVSGFEEVDANRLMSYGASQGGALALIAAALYPNLSKTVSIYPFLSDFKRVLELGNNSEAYDELFRYFKYSDPFHETESKMLDTLSYIDIKNFASMIKCPVAMVTGLEDSVCPPSTQFAVYNRLQVEKQMKILPDYGHDAMHVKVNDYVYDYLIGTSFL
ncbi:acetylxylan esterase [Streptococcus suis]|uniref:acetylxylan esterase n=1 Tax=Streptococcus suis TaxID=1307 RepID=UPI0004223D6D|nr:acetylxylan esterase [Streptococcus suis]